MDTLVRIPELRRRLDSTRCDGRSVGLVPTMGFLHDGHAALIRRAASECDEVVVSVFVNPLQFGPGEDLEAYPRDPVRDAAVAEAAGATVTFLPGNEEMYPGGREAVLTSVAVERLSGVMEGRSRPTHFGGVCAVVAKLFNIAGPCTAYFGEKDYQQYTIISAMAHDLSVPVQVVACPTSREPDGLALSSRNAYLTDAERRVAPVLHEALRIGAARIRQGETDPVVVRAVIADTIRAAPLGDLDYVEVADPRTLEPVRRASPEARLFGAVRFGRARLIDNIAASVGTSAGVGS